MRKQFFLLPWFVLAPLFFSCDLSELDTPESVSVKTDGRYSFSLGNYHESVEKYLNTQDLLSSIAGDDNDSSTITVYDYNPGGNADSQQFLAKIEVLDQDLPSIEGFPSSGNDDGWDFTLKSGENDFDTGVKPSALLGEVSGSSIFQGASLQYTRLPVYLYCSMPDGVNLDTTNSTVSLKLGGETLEGLSVNTKCPVSEAAGTVVTTKNLGDGVNAVALFEAGGTEETAEDTGDTLKLSYSLALSGGGTPSGNVTITMCVVLPLEFQIKKAGSVSDPVEIDIMNLDGEESDDEDQDDLFGRSEKTDTSDIDKYMGVIKSCLIDYSLEKTTVLVGEKPLYVRVAFYDGSGGNDGSGNDGEDPATPAEPIYDSGTNPDSVIQISKSDIEKMLNAYPLNADIWLYIPAGSYKVPRLEKAQISVDFMLQLATDGTITLFD